MGKTQIEEQQKIYIYTLPAIFLLISKKLSSSPAFEIKNNSTLRKTQTDLITQELVKTKNRQP